MPDISDLINFPGQPDKMNHARKAKQGRGSSQLSGVCNVEFRSNSPSPVSPRLNLCHFSAGGRTRSVGKKNLLCQINCCRSNPSRRPAKPCCVKTDIKTQINVFPDKEQDWPLWRPGCNNCTVKGRTIICPLSPKYPDNFGSRWWHDTAHKMLVFTTNTSWGREELMTPHFSPKTFRRVSWQHCNEFQFSGSSECYICAGGIFRVKSRCRK